MDVDRTPVCTPADTAAFEPWPVAPAEWPALGAFIFRHNRSPDGRVRCLHGDQGDDEHSHAAELAALPVGEAAFWRVAGADGETLGVIGCEIDRLQQRAWLRGPWAAAGTSSAGSLEVALLGALERGLPEVERFDAFPAEHDAALAGLYHQAGYGRMGVHRVMQATLADATTPAADPRVETARAGDLPGWLPLHHTLFPGSYLSDAEITAAIDDAARLVLTARLEGRPAGYLVAKDDPTMDELYVDYLGVDPAARGQGLGRGLLQHALGWGAGRGRKRAALTVRQDRTEALSLYLQCGFEQASAGVHWRKDRTQSSRP